MKTVYFVRHGQTIGNVEKFYQHYDTPLTEVGERGAEAVATRCAELDAEVVISSDMRRAQHTAEIITAKTGLPHVIEPSFHEILQAESVRGLPYDNDVSAKYRSEWHNNFYDPNWNQEGAENYEAVLARVVQATEFLEQREEASLIVVSHGAFLMSLTTYLMFQKVEDKQVQRQLCLGLRVMSNVGMTVFEYEEGHWRLRIYNDHAHFAE